MAGRHITVDATVVDPIVFSHDHLDIYFKRIHSTYTMQTYVEGYHV